MFHQIVNILTNNANLVKLQFSRACADMFGIHTFELLEHVDVTINDMEEVFFKLQDWEIQEVRLLIFGIYDINVRI